MDRQDRPHIFRFSPLSSPDDISKRLWKAISEHLQKPASPPAGSERSRIQKTSNTPPLRFLFVDSDHYRCRQFLDFHSSDGCVCVVSLSASEAILLLEQSRPYDALYLGDFYSGNNAKESSFESGLRVVRHIVSMPIIRRPRLVVLHMNDSVGAREFLSVLKAHNVNAEHIPFDGLLREWDSVFKLFQANNEPIKKSPFAVFGVSHDGIAVVDEVLKSKSDIGCHLIGLSTSYHSIIQHPALEHVIVRTDVVLDELLEERRFASVFEGKRGVVFVGYGGDPGTARVLTHALKAATRLGSPQIYVILATPNKRHRPAVRQEFKELTATIKELSTRYLFLPTEILEWYMGRELKKDDDQWMKTIRQLMRSSLESLLFILSDALHGHNRPPSDPVADMLLQRGEMKYSFGSGSFMNLTTDLPNPRSMGKEHIQRLKCIWDNFGLNEKAAIHEAFQSPLLPDSILFSGMMQVLHVQIQAPLTSNHFAKLKRTIKRIHPVPQPIQLFVEVQEVMKTDMLVRLWLLE